MTASGSTDSQRENELAELFRTHRSGLAGAVRAVLGDPDDGAEILQDAFVKSLRAIRQGTRPADPVAWIFVITMNLAKDRRRQHARRRKRSRGLEDVPEAQMQSDREQGPVAEAARSEAVDAARAAIARLEDGEKEVFLLRVSGGMTFEAAATALEIPVGTAKTRMRAALARLRKELGAFAPQNLGSETQIHGGQQNRSSIR